MQHGEKGRRCGGSLPAYLSSVANNQLAWQRAQQVVAGWEPLQQRSALDMLLGNKPTASWLLRSRRGRAQQQPTLRPLVRPPHLCAQNATGFHSTTAVTASLTTHCASMAARSLRPLIWFHCEAVSSMHMQLVIVPPTKCRMSAGLRGHHGVPSAALPASTAAEQRWSDALLGTVHRTCIGKPKLLAVQWHDQPQPIGHCGLVRDERGAAASGTESGAAC